MEEIKERFARYLEAKLEGIANAQVETISRIHGGASRETFRLQTIYEQGGAPVSRGLILRRDPVGSLIDTERETEFAAYTAFHQVDGVPVPEPIALELDESWLDRPFFVMSEVTDCAAASPFAPEPYVEPDKIGEQFWTILGTIAKQDPVTLGLDKSMKPPALDECARDQLNYWENVIDDDELGPEPIARAAIRWLRRTAPAPAQKLSVVHGDYRTGNFLFDGASEIKAVLDWEMCHLGDPLEDLAWALDPLWAFQQPGRPGGMIARDKAIRLWEESSGLTADPHALAWWEVFASVKGLAIWISSAHEYVTGKNQDPVLAFSGWYCTSQHNRILAAKLARLARDRREKGEVA